MFDRIKQFLKRESKGDDEDSWSRRWNARSGGISAMLGATPEEGVFHSPVPLYLGGFADVIVFREYVSGYTYVTCDVSGDPGQEENVFGSYELMVCTREKQAWAPQLISQLAKYTFEAALEPGETMDIGAAMPQGSVIDALLFTQPDVKVEKFYVENRRCGLILCTGITREELEFKLKHGAEPLLEKLRKAGIYPYTDLNRVSAL